MPMTSAAPTSSAERGIHYLDCGTSGGIFGLERGFCLMVGGDEGAFRRLEPIFASLAPGVDAASRTPGRDEIAPEEHGYLHCGESGAGHFVKMVHNGIEYGLMAALAEGFGILQHAGRRAGGARSGTPRPRRSHMPELYRYSFDLPAIAELWRRGSVVSSWLLDLTAAALVASPDLEGFAGRVSDSGEGRWTSVAAIDTGTPAPVLTTALYSRFTSRGEADFCNRLLSAMRAAFGGHLEKPK